MKANCSNCNHRGYGPSDCPGYIANLVDSACCNYEPIRNSDGSRKDTNPKDAVGVKKVPTHVIPCRVVLELGLAMLEGARKYGSHNYRISGILASVYYDAARRHLDSFWEGEDIDPDSGLSHLVKAMACLTVLRDGMHAGNWIDDRPPRIGGGAGIRELNELASNIIEKYPDCIEPFTEKNKIERK